MGKKSRTPQKLPNPEGEGDESVRSTSLNGLPSNGRPPKQRDAAEALDFVSMLTRPWVAWLIAAISLGVALTAKKGSTDPLLLAARLEGELPTLCPRWVQLGECARRANFMRTACPLACDATTKRGKGSSAGPSAASTAAAEAYAASPLPPQPIVTDDVVPAPGAAGTLAPVDRRGPSPTPARSYYLSPESRFNNTKLRSEVAAGGYGAYGHDWPVPLPRTVSWAPRVSAYDNFLSDEECARLIELAKKLDVGPIPIVRKDGGTAAMPTTASGSIGFFSKLWSEPVLRAVHERIAQLSGLPPTYGEQLAIVKYEKGEYFNAHLDMHPLDDRRTSRRVATFVAYLNAPGSGEADSDGAGAAASFLDPAGFLGDGDGVGGVEAVGDAVSDDGDGADDARAAAERDGGPGGETYFPFGTPLDGLTHPVPAWCASHARKDAAGNPQEEWEREAYLDGSELPEYVEQHPSAPAGLSVRPKKGTGMLLWNTLPNGTSDARAQQTACPVRYGTKWVLVKWMYDREYDDVHQLLSRLRKPPGGPPAKPAWQDWEDIV